MASSSSTATPALDVDRPLEIKSEDIDKVIYITITSTIIKNKYINLYPEFAAYIHMRCVKSLDD